MRDQAVPIEIKPVNAAIGAELSGVQLSGQLDPAAVAEIRAALLQYKVIFFRDQLQFDDTTQEDFAALFGDLQKHPMTDAAGQSQSLMQLTEGYSASVWHTDMTFLPTPAALAILRPLKLPSRGGDTMWANTESAYEGLPHPLKALVGDLWALHSSEFDFDGTFNESYRSRMADYTVNTRKYAVETEHPVTHIHPETGKRALLLGSWVKRFVGLRNADSTKILEILQEYVTAPENTLRWQWRMGDVAMWDNRSTQHRAVPDYGDEPRIFHRATVLGSIPVAIDGRESRQLTMA